MAEENTSVPAPAPAPSKGVKHKFDKAGPKGQALKRNRLSLKRALINSALKSRVHTAKRRLADAVAKKADAETIKPLLSTVFSLMDKAAKKGVFKKNKANRTKSRLAARSIAV
jgi:small subunit ribosomal protein S20